MSSTFSGGGGSSPNSIWSKSEGTAALVGFFLLGGGGADSPATVVAGLSPIDSSMAAFLVAPPSDSVARTLFAKPLKPNSWNSSISRGPSQSRRRQPSQSNAIGTSLRSVTSVLLFRRSPFAMAALNASRTFGPPSLSTFAIRLSSEPYSCSHFVAVFAPTPATPGTLSAVSPTSV